METKTVSETDTWWLDRYVNEAIKNGFSLDGPVIVTIGADKTLYTQRLIRQKESACTSSP